MISTHCSTPVHMTTSVPTLISGGQARLCTSNEESPQNAPVHYSSSISPKPKLSRYRSMFNNPMSPLTPSFGILPLESNTPEPAVPPSHTTLTEANDQKSLAKRVRAHVGVSRQRSCDRSISSFPPLQVCNAQVEHSHARVFFLFRFAAINVEERGAVAAG